MQTDFPMPSFITDDFLLHSAAARALYHGHAKPLPIFDYHSHLPPADIAQNRTFDTLYDVWLAGDHYKWRAMRWNGVPEDLITGAASPREKFFAFARTVPKLLRNPLYHWTHLELQRFFGIDLLLSETTADEVWHRASEQLADMPVHAMLRKMRVAVSCTTDDPADGLADHRAIAAGLCPARVYPTFRPDGALAVDNAPAFNAWCERLAATVGHTIDDFDEFMAAVEAQFDAFHAAGGRLCDHGLLACVADEFTPEQSRSIFDAARRGESASPKAAGPFVSHMMQFFAWLAADRGWTMQLHLGPLRDVSSRGRREIGPNAGFDSVGDAPQANALARFLDSLDAIGSLPKTILYNANPADNYAFATMAGNFQDASIPGKIQFGSGWWFLDQKDGMTWQLNALSNLGLLSRFVGMVTDSRSFLSFPRHEYFRRLLCDLIGRDVERGELPRDMPLLGQLVEDVCYHNAARYFGLELPPEYAHLSPPAVVATEASTREV